MGFDPRSLWPVLAVMPLALAGCTAVFYADPDGRGFDDPEAFTRRRLSG